MNLQVGISESWVKSDFESSSLSTKSEKKVYRQRGVFVYPFNPKDLLVNSYDLFAGLCMDIKGRSNMLISSGD